MKMKFRSLTLLFLLFPFVSLFAQTENSCEVEMVENGKVVKFTAPEKEGIPIITLEQTPGEFVQKSLKLKPGKYRFRVANQNVDHEVGLYLRSVTTKKPLQNSGTNGHIKMGESKETGIVELKAGEYLYSCPLNPTGDFKIIVSSN